ncbi:MAG: glycerol kinase GlpK [Hellea sp.]
MENIIIAIDQGTTSSRTLVFSLTGETLFVAQEEFPQLYPKDGWVEHNPEDIWNSTLNTLKLAYEFIKKNTYGITGLGITNQRETTILWDKLTGEPIYNAIVWQDRRTAKICEEIKLNYSNNELNSKTGLLIDPYFSSTKISWILDNVKGAREKAVKGELAFGTIDTFLIWRLTKGKSHYTDATNASRTNLFNIHNQTWDKDLLKLFKVPVNVLPTVKNSADNFGHIDFSILGESIPIFSAIGDQQAAAVGQNCFVKGDIKSTYGTGCFVILNTGEECVKSKNNLISTICYRLNGKVTYALEGSIFIAGAAVQWLRDGIKIIKTASDVEPLCGKHNTNRGVYLVPAFTGLGAPHWDPNARGALFGITRDTGREDIARAAIESTCYQTYDLIKAMSDDGIASNSMRVDGGMVENQWMVQFLSDILDIPIECPSSKETTALGAAYLVGLQAGIYKSLDDIKKHIRINRHYSPKMGNEERTKLLNGWVNAVKRVLSNYP